MVNVNYLGIEILRYKYNQFKFVIIIKWFYLARFCLLWPQLWIINGTINALIL